MRSQTQTRAKLALLAACALACASGLFVLAAAAPDPDEDRARLRVNLFITPAGEPVRSTPGGTDAVDVWFARVDANHDGAITLDELQADFRTFFGKLDANHDKLIDGFEIGDYEQKIAPEILPSISRLRASDIPPLPKSSTDPRSQQDDRQRLALSPSLPRRRGGPQGAAFYSLFPNPEPVASMDSDFDGKVSLEEALAAARRRFDMLDTNHDGRLTRAELPRTPAEKAAAKGAKDKGEKGDEGRRRRHGGEGHRPESGAGEP